MVPQTPITPITPVSNSEVTYQVMPQAGNSGPAITSGPLPPVAPPPGAGGPLPLDSGESFFRTSKFYIIVAVVAALILGAAGWYLFGTNKSDTTPPSDVSKLPSVWLKQHFDKNVCDDKAICGDEADSDADGLTNYDEFKAGTVPVNPDTDQDGLADGDEVHVYKTDPALKYTDRRPEVASNNWTDAVQIKNGYDPNISAAKLSDARIKQISDDTAKFGLHEPTKTTMGIQSSSGTPPPVAGGPTNCGTFDSLHVYSDPQNPTPPTTTVAEKAALNCMDTAIVNCSPASIDNTITGSNDKGTTRIIGKNGANCSIQIAAQGKTSTCQVPLGLIASFKAGVDAQPKEKQYDGLMTASIQLLFVGAAFAPNNSYEVSNPTTGEKVMITCNIS